jgi:hypothetical protein
MDKFDKKLKEITEGLMSTQNEAIIESHFEHMNEAKQVSPVKGEYGKVTIFKQMKKDGLLAKKMKDDGEDLRDVVRGLNFSTKRVKRGKDIIFTIGDYELKYPVDWEEPKPVNKPSELVKLVESESEELDEGMPSKVKILNALKNMSAEEVAKKFNIRLADVKQIEKETMNESNDLSDEEIKDLATKYIELKMKLKNEPQFNRKVDINRELKTFLKNNPEIRGKDDTAQGINIFYKDRKVAGIKPQYAKKKVNLSYKRLKNDAIKFYI